MSETMPRCPHCCVHGILLTRNCGWCEPHNEPYEDLVADDQPMWLCPHGVGEQPAVPGVA